MRIARLRYGNRSLGRRQKSLDHDRATKRDVKHSPPAGIAMPCCHGRVDRAQIITLACPTED
jgi:hypothetical protein